MSQLNLLNSTVSSDLPPPLHVSAPGSEAKIVRTAWLASTISIKLECPSWTYAPEFIVRSLVEHSGEWFALLELGRMAVEPEDISEMPQVIVKVCSHDTVQFLSAEEFRKAKSAVEADAEASRNKPGAELNRANKRQLCEVFKLAPD